MQSIVSLLAILANLLPVCRRVTPSYADDCASLIETLKGFEIIFAEGLETADTHVALYDSIEDARELLNEVDFALTTYVHA